MSDVLGGRVPGWALGLAPVAALAIVLVAFVVTAPLAGVPVGEPVPDVTVSHHTVPDGETIVLHVTNNGPEAVTIAQVLVDDAYWSFEVAGTEGGTLEARESARVIIPYHWEPGWDYHVDLVLSEGATVGHTIEAIQQNPGVGLEVLWALALVGLFVGVIPVAIGMAWYPAMRSLSDRWMHAVLAFAGGILAFLGFDAIVEALEVAEAVPGAFEGTMLVVLGVLGSLVAIQAVVAWTEGRYGGARATSGLVVAYLVALAIGLHNLAEGLAIGSAFAVGRASLGVFLVVGFMLHNVTEGPAVVAPVARERRPSLWHFAAMGLLAGAPVILGGWIGGFAYSPVLGAVFLAVGVGAILQVEVELARLIAGDPGRTLRASTLLAFLVGLVVMYATDLLIVL